MANLKSIRRRITSVRSTQKITRALKMVAGARLSRAQQRIVALRPYAVKTAQVLAKVAAPNDEGTAETEVMHPLLERRPERNVLLLVITSDRGQCGAFNSNILRAADRAWHEREAQGQKVSIAVIGRKGRDFFQRRRAPLFHVFSGVWERPDLQTARSIARTVLTPFARGEVDSVYLVYNEFKSAMSQKVVVEPLFPLRARESSSEALHTGQVELTKEFLFEPTRAVLLDRLVPMYIEISVLRALYESTASELGARMTAMDSATRNASEMIDRLTLEYNRARQAAITKELMEIIGGAEALRE